MKQILLVGNPNVGKSTLFNTLTNSNAKTGNFHGVTVDEKVKKVEFFGEQIEIVDLPGLYSLSPNSFEEQVSVDYILSHPNSDIIVVTQSSCLKKNLLLFYELCELNRKIILFVNQMPNGGTFDEKKLEKLLNVKVIVGSAKNKNIKEIIKENIQKNNFYSSKINIQINSNLLQLKNKMNFSNISKNMQDFFLYKAFSGCEYYQNKFGENNKKYFENIGNEYLQNNITQKYEYINNLLNKANYKQTKVVGKSKLDKILLNKYLCLPIFLIIIFAIFYLTFFSLGAYLSSFLKYFIVDKFGSLCVESLKNICQIEWIIDLFNVGIFGGVGTIISFLPQVVLLFLFLSILEDSGYISRLAFMLDDTLKKVGLCGKSVYTLIMGFGCSTTACLTARTNTDKNAKIKTAILAPFMSCSAKLPVYAVIGGAFFGANNIFIIVCLYILGVVIALLLSLFFEKFFLKSSEQTFIMEFPDYQLVSVKSMAKVCLVSAKSFLIRIGSLLAVLSVIVWVLESFSFDFSYVKYSQKESILESLGKILSPIFVPLGFSSWGITSALLAGVVAKEIIISSIAIFNGVSPDNPNFMQSVSNSLKISSSVVFFTPASALSFMVFCLLYTPCISTIIVLKKEIGKKWTLICVILQFVLAYITAMLVFAMFSIIMFVGILNSILIIFGILCLLNIIKMFFWKKGKRRIKNHCNGCNLCS